MKSGFLISQNHSFYCYNQWFCREIWEIWKIWEIWIRHDRREWDTARRAHVDLEEGRWHSKWRGASPKTAIEMPPLPNDLRHNAGSHCHQSQHQARLKQFSPPWHWWPKLTVSFSSLGGSGGHTSHPLRIYKYNPCKVEGFKVDGSGGRWQGCTILFDPIRFDTILYFIVL